MQPYVIRQGDYLLKVAYEFDFDADTVWNDTSNADLRELRPDPNILFAGDVLYIPDQTSDAPIHDLAPGSTTTFVASDVPTVTITQQFVGEDETTYASKAYVVQELDHLTGLSTDGSGVATFEVPVTLAAATIVFTDTGEAWALRIGEMDPIDTMLGIGRRLQNLGYISTNIQFDTVTPLNNIAVLRTGLLALKAAQAASGDADADSAPSSSPSSESTPAISYLFGYADTSDADPCSDSTPASESEDDASDDDGGLSGDGTLDADTTNLLRKVHGC